MRAEEFILEFWKRKPKDRGQAHRDGIDLEAWKDGLEFQIDATAHGRDLGRVLFDVQYQGDQPVLVAKDLMILPEYRGQGIAAIMYDYAKELGYQVERSPEQTNAGKAFWDKNRGEEGQVWENFADGKKPGRKGLAKRSGVDCKQSVTKLRSIAAHSSGERQRMAHWCANMKSGKKRTNEVITVPTVAKGKRQHLDVMPNDGRPIPQGQESENMGERVGRLGSVEVWMYNQGPVRTFVTFDPATRISQLAVTGSRYPGNPDSFIVKGVYSGPRNETRAADLYAWLVNKLGLTLISDRKQSPGGQRVWQELEQRHGRSVNIYAYNLRTNQPVNTGADDPESTHGRRGDIAQNVRLIAAPK